MSYDFELTCELTAPPEAVYAAWLSTKGHTEMTGAEAEVSDKVGAEFSAWDGYISGRNLELVPGQKIVQAWRTTEFTDDDPDSVLTIELTPIKTGTRLKLSHSGAPDGQTSYEEHGWREFYFEPMEIYFKRLSKTRWS
jgi:uncharacterized protein YndB with AHSA1/START domain